MQKPFKAKVVIEELKERETLNGLAKKYEIHPNQIACWKEVFFERVPQLFEMSVSEKKEYTDLDKLYAKIGQLEMERDLLMSLGTITNQNKLIYPHY
jgi:transposase